MMRIDGRSVSIASRVSSALSVVVVTTAWVDFTATLTGAPIALLSSASSPRKSRSGAADWMVILARLPDAAPYMAMPALSGPRSLSEISISESIAPSCGSSDLSFKNNPTIPHMGSPPDGFTPIES